MKKALYLILFSVFAFISFCVIVLFAITSKEENITVLIAEVFMILCFYSPAILFYLLYEKEKNKKLPESEKNYKGLRRFGKRLYVCSFLIASEAIISLVAEIYNYANNREDYVYFNLNPYSRALTPFICYFVLFVIFLVSYWVINHFLRKWERPASLQGDSDK